MADIAANHFTTSFDLVDRTIYTTGSISPANNALVLLACAGEKAAGASASPTIAGNGLTWVEIDSQTYSSIASPLIRLSLFRAMGASPSSGTVTITFEAEQKIGRWSIMEFTNVDTTGTNGSGAIVQSVKAVADADVSPFSVTLASFGHTNNATLGTLLARGSVIKNAGSGFTLVVADDSQSLAFEYKIANDTTVDFEFNVTSDVIVFGTEIKAADQSSTRVSGAHGKMGFMF